MTAAVADASTGCVNALRSLGAGIVLAAVVVAGASTEPAAPDPAPAVWTPAP